MPIKFLSSDELLGKAKADKAALGQRRDEEIAAVNAKYAAEEAEIDAFIKRIQTYSYVPASVVQLSTSTPIIDVSIHKRPSGRMGPVATAILGLPGLREGMTTQQVVQALHAMEDLRGKLDPENKPIYNGLYGLVASKRIQKDGDVYRLIKELAGEQVNLLAAE